MFTGGVLLFWGVQAGLWVPALLLALALEGIPRSSFRLAPSTRDFERLADLSSVIFLLALGYLAATRQSLVIIFTLVSWLPMILAPLLVAFAASAQESLPLCTLFWSLRKGNNQDRFHPPWLYALTVLVASGAATAGSPWFFPGAVFFAAWALWGGRNRRFSPLVWGLVLILVVVGSLASARGLARLQGVLEEKAVELFSEWLAAQHFDPFRNRTSIGEVGRLKMSQDVVMQVIPKPLMITTFLFREAAFDLYGFGQWSVHNPGVTPLSPQGDGTTWILHPGEKIPDQGFIVRRKLDGEGGVVGLPAGAVAVAGLPVSSLAMSRMGTVTVDGGPGFVSYGTAGDVRAGSSRAGAATATDLLLPSSQKQAILHVAREMGLSRERPPAERISRIEAFFRDGFTYSLEQTGTWGESAPMSDFLLNSRRGHCEYFAAATVFLLRYAGIPARYAVGFSVQEYDHSQRAYLVRSRHAHAWALAYVDGRWLDVDTTPPDWGELEAQGAPFWQPALDLYTRLSFAFAEWRSNSHGVGWLLPVIVPLLVVLLIRWVKGFTRRAPPARGLAIARQGMDSPFFRIEQMLGEGGTPRREGETLQEWLRRLGREDLQELRALHDRYRFDPAGLRVQEEERLREETKQWLARLNRP